MQAAEIELKFSVASLPALLAQLQGAGFTLETPRTLESNTLYDTPERTLRERGEILRLRVYGARQVLTHKRHPDEEDPAGRFKVRIETESELSDAAAVAEVFCRLGYGPAFRYEKYRTEYTQLGEQQAHLVIDETPIGVFAELEGTPEWIDRTLALLTVEPERCTTASYGKLFLEWKRRTGSAAAHLTFDAVAVLPV